MKLSSLFKTIKWRFARKFYSKDRYQWFCTELHSKDFKDGKIIPLDEYTKRRKSNLKGRKRIICIYDGKIPNGGLVDRLRAIVSIYIICKKHNYDFKILFTSPFPIEKYLVPNRVDWLISQEDLNYNLRETDICFIDSKNGSEYEGVKQEKFFTKEFKKNYKEFHVRTNAHFAYRHDFAAYFSELFSLSPLLHRLIEEQKNILGNNYISTSFRFLDLLGDFNEPAGRKIVKSDAERAQLVEKNIQQLKLLHKKYPQTKILVNSDSCTFLAKATELEYTHIIPGDISHVDSHKTVGTSPHDKTFADFFMIAQATEVYLFITGEMYDSGFPYAAARLYGKPFHKIRF